MTDERKEFDLIHRLFAPLSAHRPEALDLLDDAAILAPVANEELVVTTDCLVAGIHYRAGDPPQSVAARALRVNLSDLAAMGSVPDCYTMALAIPHGCDEEWLTEFAGQLGADQDSYGINLVGGDTVSTPGPMTISITAFGRIPVGRGIRRSTARPGDDIYVSGHIGDALLGLDFLNNAISDIAKADAEYLVDRFWYPCPRTALGPALRGVASAMADVSDGFVADLVHVCSASGVGATVNVDEFVFSAAAKTLLASAQTSSGALLTGGDDYELIFTAAPSARGEVESIAQVTATSVSRVGAIHKSETASVELVNNEGMEIVMDHATGYEHTW